MVARSSSVVIGEGSTGRTEGETEKRGTREKEERESERKTAVERERKGEKERAKRGGGWEGREGHTSIGSHELRRSACAREHFSPLPPRIDYARPRRRDSRRESSRCDESRSPTDRQTGCHSASLIGRRKPRRTLASIALARFCASAIHTPTAASCDTVSG